MRKHHPFKVRENVYWISAAAAARHARDADKGVKTWRRARLPQGLRAVRFTQVKAVAWDVAAELEEFVRTRFLQAIGLALAGGTLSATMLALV